MKKLAVVVAMMTLAWFGIEPIRAATYTVSSSQNWSAFSPQPTSADAIVVQNAATLTVDVGNGDCASIQIGVSGSGDGTLSFQNGKQVTCAGNVTLGQGSSAGTLLMPVGGTLKVAGSLIFTPSVSVLSPGIGTTATIEYNGAGAQTIG